MRQSVKMMLLAGSCLFSLPAAAIDRVDIKRTDAATVRVSWEDKDLIAVHLVATPDAKLTKANQVARTRGNGTIDLKVPTGQRKFVRLRDGGSGKVTTVAERELPLEKGSNFRDLGGYTGAGGKTVRWGKIFRSGALPMLTSEDVALVSSLGIQSIIDLRSLEERSVAPTALDDASGALFISNDYSIKPLMARIGQREGPMYAGMETMLRPQLRAVFKRLLADDGAVMYNCSAGQDRTGITTALILTTLGVDRATILRDYHLSTELRRPQNEMPALDPALYPDNPIVQYYAAAAKKSGGPKAEPLYAPNGESLLVQFFDYVDKTYGSFDLFMARELGVGPAEVKRLRALYLQ